MLKEYMLLDMLLDMLVFWKRVYDLFLSFLPAFLCKKKSFLDLKNNPVIKVNIS